MITREQYENIKLGDQFTIDTKWVCPPSGANLWTVIYMDKCEIKLENDVHDKRYIHDGCLKLWNTAILDLI